MTGRTQVVGVGDCQLSRDPEVTLVTYALGSCIAVVVHEPVSHVAGLLHLMLPEPPEDRQANENPWMFATTGVPLLLERAAQLGADKKRLKIRLVGGAQVLDDKGFFNIGKKNHVAVRKVLWREGVLVHAEAVGGADPRTVWLEVASGRVSVREGGNATQELGPVGLKGVRQCLSAS